MQILRWLFRGSIDDQRGKQNITTNNKDQEHQPKAVISSKNRRRSKSRKLMQFIFLCNRDVEKAGFYSNIYLRRSPSSGGGGGRSCDRKQRCEQSNSMKMKKQDISRGLNLNDTQTAGNKVQPLSEATLSSSITSNEKIKGDKTKTMSRIKELLRWDAAAKTEKKSTKKVLLPLRNRIDPKAVVADDDRRFSSDSPKISFRWDSSESRSSSSSDFSVASSSRNDQTCNSVSLNSTPTHGLNRCSSRRGNWITTDSEFVVLELC